jgi:1,2-dihydroxy-3-keto-5-methylthiopentene dioxygenase
MAVVRIPEQGQTLKTKESITQYLAGINIEYRTWTPEHPTSADAPAEEILRAYKREIDELKSRGGYVTADVINVTRTTPNLDAMLAKFRREHLHDEDEVRFILAGHGVFHIHPVGKTCRRH